MHEADIDQGHPGQHRRDQQQSGGDQLGGARSRGRRLDRMVVVAVVVGVLVMHIGRMRGNAMRVVMMLDGIAARMERMRAEYRDQAGDDSADERQKDDGLDHLRASLRMIFSENRFTLFRIMLNPSSD